MKLKYLVAILLITALFLGCAGEKKEAATPTPEKTAMPESTPESAPKFKLVEPGVLTVGTDAAYPPFESINEVTNEFEGFDVDLMKEVAKRIGLEVKFVNVAWEGIIPGLVAHKYDVIASAMTITEERKKQIDFSDPYFEAWQVIVVRKDDDRISKAEDLAGKIVGVQIGTTGQFVAEDLVKEGINFEIKTYDTTPDALLDLKNGNIDACIIDNGVAEKALKNNPDTYKIVGGKLSYEEYGIAVAKDNPELLKAINQALKEIKEDGTYDKIYQKWFGE
jgi:polar amino acid transport system substrate-binding protein